MNTITTLLSSQTLWSFIVTAAAAYFGVPPEICATFVGAFGVKEAAKHYGGLKTRPS